MTLATGKRRIPPRARLAGRGFTLVEVLVTLAILALSAAVVVPALGNLSRADLRRAARSLSSIIQRCYDEAALTGQMQRLVFALGEPHRRTDAKGQVAPPVRLEVATQPLLFASSTSALLAAAGGDEGLDDMSALEALGEGPARAHSAVPPPAKPAGALGVLANINKLDAADAEDSFRPKDKVELPQGVHVMDIWIEGMDQPLTQGEAYVVFFAHGYTQNATIHLEDASRNVFTLHIAALTGRTSVQDGYLEMRR